MTKELPPFLRLHVADESTLPASPPSAGDSFATVAAAFEIATGWSLVREPQQADVEANHGQRLAVRPIPQDQPRSQDEPSIDRWRAALLADSISDLYARIDRLQLAVWQREAELAIGVPVSPKRQEEEHLAARLEVMLRNGAEAVGCCAAGLYLLDDATTQLKLRACWGLSRDRLLAPARPLAGAFAELEALIGHAIVLEDVNLLPHWKTPEPFPAAICLPVSSPTDPLGTIWFFADSTRDFSDREVHLAEIIAGSIAAELQREVLLGECLAAKQADRQIVRAVQWQHDHLPTIKPLVDDWDLAGWSALDDDLASGFYDWFIPQDGSLAVALGTCGGLPVESALSAGALQATVRAHAEYAHDTAAMIARVNESIWNGSAGGYEASLFYAQVTPGSGAIEYSAAGRVQAILIQQSGVELIEAGSPGLGVLPDSDWETTRHCFDEGDLLLLLVTASDRPSLQLEMARQLRSQRGASADDLLGLARSLDRGLELALVVQRRRSLAGAGH